MRRVWFVLMVSIVAALLASAALAVVTTPTPVPSVIEGTITAVVVTTPTTGKVTVQIPTVAGSTVVKPPLTFAVNERTKLFKDGNACALAALAVGDLCRAAVIKTSEGSLLATMVYAKTVVPPLRIARGTIVEKKVYDTWGRTFKLNVPGVGTGPAILLWFSVGEKTKIIVDGKPANYDQLAVGQIAEVGYVVPPPSLLPVITPILAASVAAKNPPPPPITHRVGRLVSVDAANGIIRVLTGPTSVPLAFKVTNDTRIDKFGPSTLGALIPAGVIPGYPGDMVDVAAKISPVAAAVPPVAISVLVIPETRMGVVNRVVGDTLWLAPRTSAGAVLAPIPFKVVAATRIIKNGLPVTLAQLMPRDSVTLRYFQFWDGKVAQRIEARSSLLPPPPALLR